MQKQVKEELRIESLASWEKFCNSISLENNANESWRKIKNFLKLKGQRYYPALHHANKVAKTNDNKAQLFAESVERHSGILIRITLMRSTNLLRIIIDIFILLRTQMTTGFDVGNEHELVNNVDAQTLIKLVKFLKRGKAPGPDNIHNEVLRLGTTTSLFHHLARLRMLLKPDKLPSLTTSYRPISLISSIMKLFERVIEQQLRSHLEHIGFINKHQSGFRKAR